MSFFFLLGRFEEVICEDAEENGEVGV